MGSEKNGMDVLQQWLNDYNAYAKPTAPLRSGGEAGGAQLRLRFEKTGGQVSILHMVAVERDGRPAIIVKRFDGPATETALQAGLWASEQLGRR